MHAHHHCDSHAHHHHGHTHSASVNTGHAFLLAAALNMAFILVEVWYGVQADSLALLADAGHNAGDVLSLLLAWGAHILSARKPSARYTYGLRSTSIMAALVNALLLLVVVAGIAWEALQRLGDAQAVEGHTVIVVALIGVGVNGVTALLFMRGAKGDLNVRAAFLHLASDAAISLGVALSGLLVLYTGLMWLDPVTSLAVSLVIVISAWGLLKNAVDLSLHAVPSAIDSAAVRAYLASLGGVKEVHDLHIWGMSTTEIALSAHLIMPGGHPGDAFLHKANETFKERFGITHATIQIEMGDATQPCALAPEHVV